MYTCVHIAKSALIKRITKKTILKFHWITTYNVVCVVRGWVANRVQYIFYIDFPLLWFLLLHRCTLQITFFNAMVIYTVWFSYWEKTSYSDIRTNYYLSKKNGLVHTFRNSVDCRLFVFCELFSAVQFFLCHVKCTVRFSVYSLFSRFCFRYIVRFII